MPTSWSLSARTRLSIVVGLFAALIASMTGASPASFAAPAAPSGLTPSAASQPVSGIPVLSWSRVSGATSYSVEVARDSNFGTVIWKTSTVNTKATPTVQLPTGTIWWRVRGAGSDGTGPFTEASFERSSIAGPSLIEPASGTVLPQPSSPALLQWNPVRGATDYTIEVSTDENFVDPSLRKTYTTRTAAYVVPDPQVANTYHWRVRATLGTGVFTDWSETRNYAIGGLAKPQLVGPADSPDTDVTDVVLDWQPVVGAKTYDVQVSTDNNFNTVETSASPTGVTGTRYSPKITLGNDQYFWRVRPVDAIGNKLDWGTVDTWTFRRHWPHQPVLEHPVNDASTGDDIYFQWSAVRHASSYVLQLSLEEEFNTLYDSCSTVNTTFVPTTNGDCFPQAGLQYWWRVIALDSDKGVVTDSISAQRERFNHDPTRPSLISPTQGATVEVPTLTWSPVSAAESYRVTITAVTSPASGGGTFNTTGTSFTPRSKLTVGATYRWQVQTVNGARIGTGLLADSQPRFTVAELSDTPAATPEPLSPANLTQSHRFPTLAWSRHADATRYRVWIRPLGQQSYTALPDYFSYPAGEDDGTAYLSSGTYEWFVQALSGSTHLVDSTSTATFTIAPLTAVSGHRLALRGSALSNDATSCLAALPAKCLDLRQTPVLRWNALPGAGYYNVYLSRDAEMTEVLSGHPKRSETNQFTPPTALIDSQAGSAFYWFVQPCKTANKCSALAHAKHAFNKLSNPVELIAPLGGTVANEVTFTWKDYLVTNSTNDAAHKDSTGVSPRVEARYYRIQVSADPNFQSILDDQTVDQMTYTAYTTTYPEGPLHWRVQALDGSKNALTWSTVTKFEKKSTIPTQLSPVNGETITAIKPFRWQPLPYAAGYDVEVFKNGDTTGSSTNRVAVATNVKQVSFTLTSPLPPSSANYTWRVRRLDAKGRPGPWSDLALVKARFHITASAPTLVSPAAGVLVSPTNTLFQWTAVERAATYTFERRLVGATSAAERVTTAALSWAPVKLITDGAWEWRVIALDAAKNQMGASSWRRFNVDGSRPTVTAYSPSSYGKPKANFTVTFSEPVTNVTKKTFQLRRKGVSTPIKGRLVVASDGFSAKFNPKPKLKRGKKYVAKVKKTIKDTNGNSLVPKKWVVTIR